MSKKEGNITIANAANNLTNSINRQAQAPCNPTPATALLPPGEGSNSPPATGNLLLEGTGLPQSNSQAMAHLPPREGNNSPPATGHLLLGGTSLPQANSQVIGSHHIPAIAHLPPEEGSNSSQATVHLPQKVTALPIVRHQAVFLLWQLLTFLLGKEAVLPGNCSPFLRR